MIQTAQMDKLLHIKVGDRLKSEIDSLIDEGLFSNHAELVREGLRDILILHESKEGNGKEAKGHIGK